MWMLLLMWMLMLKKLLCMKKLFKVETLAQTTSCRWRTPLIFDDRTLEGTSLFLFQLSFIFLCFITFAFGFWLWFFVKTKISLSHLIKSAHSSHLEYLRFWPPLRDLLTSTFWLLCNAPLTKCLCNLCSPFHILLLNAHFSLFLLPDLNYCTHNRPCKNGGTCRNSGQGGFTCDCPDNYSGDRCEVLSPVVSCQKQDCINGGTCMVSFNKQKWFRPTTRGWLSLLLFVWVIYRIYARMFSRQEENFVKEKVQSIF